MSYMSYFLSANAVEIRFLEVNRDMHRLPGDSQFYAKESEWRNTSDVCILWGQR